MSEVFPIIVPVKSSLKSINFYLLKTNQSLMLIDAGLNNDDCWNALNDTLNKNKFGINDITHMILTHHHIDHAGLVNRVVSANPVPVFAHPLSFPRLKRDPEFIQMRIEFFEELYNEMGCGESGRKQVEHLRRAAEENESQKIECDLKELTPGQFENLKVIEVPGHTPDQIALFLPNKKWLFSGDLLISHISSNALVEPDENGKRIRSLPAHVDSLKKCLSIPMNTVFSGHGILIENPHELIEKRIAGIERKAEKFLRLIEDGYETASDVAQAYYKDTYAKQFSLVMSKVIGHLDYLEERGRIRGEFKEGVLEYRST
ncbi:MBL fold metallo-hydrolase [Siminovitchia fortis]|nr:MBL fold metallo-hydrolase [Siminovitchia fortis]WHY80506.1 MBL fold metallo-hydrolase [Siminovitchia fortis]